MNGLTRRPPFAHTRCLRPAPVGAGLVLAIAAVGVTGCGTGQKAAATDDAPATTAPEVIDPEVTDPDVPEGFPEEGIPKDTEPESINGKVGTLPP